MLRSMMSERTLAIDSRNRLQRCRNGSRLLFYLLSIVATRVIGFGQQTPTPPTAVSPDNAMRRAEIQKVEESLAKITDRAAALFFLARRYAQLGDLGKALSLLKECIALNKGFDPGELPQFEVLHS